MEDKSPSRIENAIERLNEDPYLLATVSAVPVVGGSIAQVITGIGQQIVQKRNKELFKRLSEHLRILDEQVIKEDFFETPEGFDLLIKALDESRKTRSEEKRELITRILVGASTTEAEKGGYSPEDYLNIVAYLTPKELHVAQTMYTVQKDIRQPPPGKMIEVWEPQRDEILREHKLDAYYLPVLLNRIASTGLLSMVYEIYAGGATVPTYWVTPSFHRLMKFLSIGNASLPESQG